MEQRDEELIQLYQNGEKKAVEMLFQRYKNRILNFCLRLLGNRADAEDITGEVFLALFSNRYNVQSNAKFSTWLFTIARNQCVSCIRKKKSFVSMWFSSKDSNKEEQWDVEDKQDHSRNQLVKKEEAKQVQQAITKLAFDQRETLILREYHHFSYDEIAQIRNCSLENVKILIFRAREQLRKELTSLIREEES